MSWNVEQLRLRPDLIVCEPYEMEGTHTIEDEVDPNIKRLFYLDHHWDNTFGYAFGTVAAVGAHVTEIAPGDFVHFTRHAYIPETDENGDEWLFVNKDDCLAIIGAGANGVVETGDRVGRDAA